MRVFMGGSAMSDAMTELFTAALGMAEPWRVESVRFDREAHEIHFDVVCKATRLPCPRCATPDQPIHDRKLRDWQHLHFFQYRALIHAELPRVRCSVCGERGETEVQQVAVPWARARSGFTLMFEAMVVTLAGMSRMSVRRIGDLLGVNDERLWRSLGALVDAAYAHADMSNVDAIGIDEKHVGRGRVVTVVHDVSGATRGRVLHLSEGCKAENVGVFVEALKAHGGDPEAVERCSMDMAKSYIAGVREHLPQSVAVLRSVPPDQARQRGRGCGAAGGSRERAGAQTHSLPPQVRHFPPEIDVFAMKGH